MLRIRTVVEAEDYILGMNHIQLLRGVLSIVISLHIMVGVYSVMNTRVIIVRYTNIMKIIQNQKIAINGKMKRKDKKLIASGILDTYETECGWATIWRARMVDRDIKYDFYEPQRIIRGNIYELGYLLKEYNDKDINIYVKINETKR